MNSEKEICRTAEELFSMLGEKFKPQKNKTILSLQYCKLKRKGHESTQEWIGRLCTRQQTISTNNVTEG